MKIGGYYYDFQRRSKKICKNQKENKLKRTKYEKTLIWNFIKERLRAEARKGQKSLDIPIILYEKIENLITGEYIYIGKSDYKKFVIRHFLKYQLKKECCYKEHNIITIFS